MLTIFLCLLITITYNFNLHGMKHHFNGINIIERKMNALTFDNGTTKSKQKHVIIVVPPINEKESSLYLNLQTLHKDKDRAFIELFKSSITSLKESLSYEHTSLYHTSLIEYGQSLAVKIIAVKETIPTAIISIVASKTGCLIATIASQLLNLFARFRERKNHRRKSLYLDKITNFKELSSTKKSDSFILKQLERQIYLYEKWYYFKGKNHFEETCFKKSFITAKKDVYKRMTQKFNYSKDKAAKRYSTGFSMSGKNMLDKMYLINTLYLIKPPNIIGSLETKEYYLPDNGSVERCIYFWSNKNSLFKGYFGSTYIKKPDLFDVTCVQVKTKTTSLKKIFTKSFTNSADIENYFSAWFFHINNLIHQKAYYYPNATLYFSNTTKENPLLTI